MQNETKTATDASKKKASKCVGDVKQSKPRTLRKVHWFANDETRVIYVREWDSENGMWANERAIERLSHVAQLLNQFQVMPNNQAEGRR
jgi:hypothetical protein